MNERELLLTSKPPTAFMASAKTVSAPLCPACLTPNFECVGINQLAKGTFVGEGSHFTHTKTFLCKQCGYADERYYR